MKIVWERKRDERLHSDGVRADRKLGYAAAERLRKCVSEINGIPNFRELTELRPLGMHRLRHSRRNQWAFWLSGRLRLVVRPDTTYTVTIVVEIVDYHRG